MSHYEISPREREDEERQWERDFGVAELQREDEADRVARTSSGPQESE